jgi:hypothetical protein
MIVEFGIGIGIEIDAIRPKFDSDPDFDLDQMERCWIATTRLIREDAGQSRNPTLKAN